MTELLIALMILSFGAVGLIHLIRYCRRLRTHLTIDLSRLTPQATPRAVILLLALLFPLLLFILAGALFFRFNRTGLVQAQEAELSVEILAGYNLVVDSNVQSPSTFGPSAATVAGRVCNNGSTTLTNVEVNIGNYTGGDSGTPGIYPSRNSGDAAFAAEHPALADGEGTGSYAFTHEGGSLGLADATRQIDTLAPGECTVQYWIFSYPRCENNADGSPDEPQCGFDATWGDSVKPEDDLWLQFDVWATSDNAPTADASWTMWMRNEISAMANKIEPNGNPGGRWFNTDPATIRPGGVITTNGILYRIGNVRFGFDNDGDYLPDYNFWVQPIGDASQFDPGCFRLIRTSGVITIAGGTPKVFTFTDQLYFTGANDPRYPDANRVPDDNTNVIGEVYYTYVALGTNCAVSPTPYQEAASGYDNEKFNADYGAGGPPPMSVPEAQVTIDKSGDPNMAALASIITYTIPFANVGTEPAGLTFFSGAYVNNPLVISDTIPAGTEYISGTADYALGSGSATIFYSTDNGLSWSESQPANPADVTNIQWWLDQPLPSGESGSATFSVLVPGDYAGEPVIENCANFQFGDGGAVDEACDTTLVLGNNSIGDFVWRDEDNDGLQDTGEAGINGVTVFLYHDADGNGRLDTGTDMLITSTVTAVSGTVAGSYLFSNLADGKYLVVVDTTDPQLPYGYKITTNEVFGVDLDSGHASATAVNYLNADFGFGPALQVTKTLLSSAAYEGRDIVFKIEVENLRGSSGTNLGNACQYDFWSNSISANGTDWSNTSDALGDPNGTYALGYPASNPSAINGSNMDIAYSGNITKVEVIYSLFNSDAFAGQEVAGQVYTNGVQLGTNNLFEITTLNLYNGSANQGILSWDITGLLSSLTLTDVNGLDVRLYIDKVGGQGDATVNLDALGLRITADAACAANPSDTLDPVPLIDTYNASLLEFVSAEPPYPHTVSSGGSSPYANTGIIEWDNIGPIPPGETKEITVTFRGTETALTSAVPLTNTAWVTSAYFVTGEPANEDEDDAVTVITPTGTITGVVWSNPDGDGWQGSVGYESGETFIPFVTLNLYQCIGIEGDPDLGRDCNTSQNDWATWQLVATTTTDINGAYIFDGLESGFYYIQSVAASLPSGGSLSGDPDATGSLNRCTDFNSPTIDCSTTDGIWNSPNAELGTMKYIGFAGLANQLEVITNINFGYTNVNPMVYGYIWQDYDADGVIDSNEPYLDNGTAGITVTLTDNLGNVLTTQTDANGLYRFTGLTANRQYTVTVSPASLPGGASAWSHTYDPDDGTTNPNHQYPVGTLIAGQTSGAHNFGYRGAADIGDTVFIDWNGDGNQDTGENGISGLTVYLYRDENGDSALNNGDTLVMTKTTSITGYYLFENVPRDSWIVQVDESTLTGYDQTADRDLIMDGQTAFTTTGTTDILDADFGYQPTGTGSIGDTVWRDLNADGVQSGSGETGLNGITITLYVDLNDNDTYDPLTDALVATAVTDSGGHYLFEDLPADNYLVDVAADAPGLPTGPYGGVYQLTTNNDPMTVTLTTGQSYLQADFGFAPPAVVGDLTYQDNNQNGQWDYGEPGILGVTVTLYIDNGTQTGVYDPGDTFYADDLTDPSGNYLFTGLPAGNYVVVVDESTLTGWSQTGDPEYPAWDGSQYLDTCLEDGTDQFGGCNAQSDFSLRLGQTDLTRDFGYLPPRAIGDRVWLDTDGDGLDADIDPFEPGLAGVTIQLLYGGSVVATTTTDIDGYYGFGGAILNNNGDYTIRVVPGTLTTTLSAGVTVTPTFDYDGINTAHEAVINLSSSPFFTEVIDFGYRYNGPRTITGTVFFDEGGLTDGLTDTVTVTDTTRYSDVIVYLYQPGSGYPVGQTTTDASGRYTFTQLFGGGSTYIVSVDRYDDRLADQAITANPGGIYNRHYYSLVITDTDVGNIDFGFYNPSPILNLVKSVTPAGAVSPGDILTYTMTVSNTGSLAATGVVITDTIPASTTFVSADPPYDGLANGVITWTLGEVATNTNRTVTMTVRIDAAIPTNLITNTAWLTSNEGITATDTVTSPLVRLTITKLNDPSGLVARGDTLTYTLVVENSGAGDATNVTISDALPGEVSANALSVSVQPSTGVTGTTPPLLLSGATITAGERLTLTVVVAVDSGLADGTVFTNTASVTSTEVVTPEVSNPVTNTVEAQADVEIVKYDVPPVVSAGDTLTYTLVFTNHGPGALSRITITEDLPAEVYNFSYDPNTGARLVVSPTLTLVGQQAISNATLVGSDYVWTGSYPPGQVISGAVGYLTFTVAVTDNLSVPADPLANVVSLTSSITDSITGNNTYTETTEVAQIIVEKATNGQDADSPTGPVVAYGDPITWTYRVTNTGSITLTNVQVRDVDLHGSQVVITPTAPITLAAGESVTLTYVSTVSFTGQYGNTATVTGTATVAGYTAFGELITSTATVTDDDLSHAATPVLALTKQVEPAGQVSAGDTLTYTIVVNNSGPVAATGVIISDTIPANTGYVANSLAIEPTSAGSVSGQPAGGLIYLDLITASANSAVTVTFQVTVVNLISEADTIITNIAELSSTTIITTATVTNPTTIDTPDVVKTVSPASDLNHPLQIGDVITYTLVTEVPPGAYVPWPYQYDYLPRGFRYVAGTFAVTTDLPFNGTSLTDTLTPPYVSARSTDTGVSGSTAGANPNVGPRSGDPEVQAIEWWLQPLDNGSNTTTGYVTVTFQVQLLGLDFQDAPVWPDQTAVYDGVNYSYLVWNIEDVGRYTSTDTRSDTSSQPRTRIGQPSLTIDKDSDPAPGATVSVGDLITYTLTITNAGRAPAYDIVITDTLATGLTYLQTISTSNPSNASLTTTGPVNQVITYTVSELAAGPDATMVITVVARVDSDGRLTNAARIPYYDSQLGDISGQRLYSDGVDSVWHETPLIDLSLDKVVDNASPSVGEEVVFTITVRNDGPSEATGVVISDVLPSGFSFVSADESEGTYNDGTGQWQTLTLANGEVVTLTITATVEASGVYTNYAQVETASEDDRDSTPGDNSTTEDDNDSVSVNPTPVIDLSLDKSVDNASPRVGDEVAFTITVSNDGPSEATGVTVSDQLPSGYTYVSDSSGGVDYNSGTGVWDIGALGVGDSISLTITATVEASGVYTNLAEVESADQHDPDSSLGNGVDTDGDGNEVDDPGDEDDGDGAVVIPLGSIGDLVFIDANRDGSYDSGTESGIDGVVLQLEYTDGTTTTTTTAGGGAYDFTNLPAGTYTVTVISGVPVGYDLTTGNLPLVVTLSESEDYSNADFGYQRPATIAVTKTLLTTDPVPVGNLVQFQIVVENTGGVTLTTVPLTDTYSTSYLSYQDANPASNDNDDDGEINWTNIAPAGIGIGQRVTVTVNFTANRATTLLGTPNYATASATDENGNPVPPDNDSARVEIVDSSLSITKTLLSNDPVEVGDPVQFRIEVVNTGGITLTTVPVTDTYDTDYLTYVDADPASDDDNNGTINWTNVGPIPVGGRAVITVNFTAAASTQDLAGDVISNTAIAAATDEYGGSVPPETDDDAVEIFNPGLVVEKTVEVARVVPNQEVTYTLTITNTGDVTLSPVLVTDTLPTGFSYVGGTPPAASPSAGPLTWTLASLAPEDGPFQITVVVEVPDDASGDYINTVEVEGTHPTGTITDTDEAPVLVTDPELALTKDVVPPGAVDGIITFTIRITNTGPSTLEQVPLIDHFTGPIVYVPERSSPPANVADNTAQELGWTDLTANTEHGFGRNLLPGESFLITTVFSLTEYTERFTMTNVATATTESGDVATDVFDNPANEAYDDEILSNVPTAVELLYFEGERQGDDVILRWATAVEIDNYAFRLLRSSTGSWADAVEIGLVPGQGRGTASGASYTFTDEAVQPDQTYTYWLVDVDVNGQETTHGPVRIDSAGLNAGTGSTIYLPLILK